MLSYRYAIIIFLFYFVGKNNCVSSVVSGAPPARSSTQIHSAASTAARYTPSAVHHKTSSSAKRMRLDHPVIFSPANYSMNSGKEASTAFPFPHPYSAGPQVTAAAEKLMSPKSASFSPPLSFKCQPTELSSTIKR